MKRNHSTPDSIRVADLAVAWLRERLNDPGRHHWSPAERRLGNAVAAMMEDDCAHGRRRSFLVMPATAAKIRRDYKGVKS